jgi:hypothetical protein
MAPGGIFEFGIAIGQDEGRIHHTASASNLIDKGPEESDR